MTGLSDREWAIIAPLLPNKPRGVARVDDRRVIDGIFYILRTGAPWRDLPEGYGPRTTVCNRYNRWAKAGVLAARVRGAGRARAGIAASDRQLIVRAHQQGRRRVLAPPAMVLRPD